MALPCVQAVILLGFSRYLVYKDGRVYDLNSAVFLKLRGANEKHTYVYFNLINDEGKPNRISQHRLLAKAFLEYPPNTDETIKLEVNHLNGVKDDNQIENLEWCFPRDNKRHAGMMGFTPKWAPVEIRNIATGEILRFEGAPACAQHLGISKDSVIWRAKSNGHQAYEGWQYRLQAGNENRYWPEPKDRDVMVRQVLTGDVRVFNLSLEAAKFMKCSPGGLSLWLGLKGQPVLPGYFQVKFLHDKTPWREVSEPEYELATFCSTKAVQIYRPETGEKKIFASASECAKHVGIRTTTLNMRLRANKNKDVYPDGYVYSYYSPVTEESVADLSLIAGNSRQVRTPLRVERRSHGFKSYGIETISSQAPTA